LALELLRILDEVGNGLEEQRMAADLAQPHQQFKDLHILRLKNAQTIELFNLQPTSFEHTVIELPLLLTHLQQLDRRHLRRQLHDVLTITVLRLFGPTQEHPLQNRPQHLIHILITELLRLVYVLVPTLVLRPRSVFDEMK
jgi:hypothetical protein